MKPLLIFTLIAITAFQSCNSQEPSKKKEFYNKEFKWTITIPENFESVTPEEWAKFQNKGAEAIEKAYDTKVENRATVIFVMRSDKMNYIEANHQPFDKATDGDYLESVKLVNDMLYGTFQSQMPDVKLDSAYSTEKIDGLTFQTFTIKMQLPNKMILTYHMYNRLFGNKELTVNIMTFDESKQRSLMAAWRNSKFGVR